MPRYPTPSRTPRCPRARPRWPRWPGGPARRHCRPRPRTDAAGSASVELDRKARPIVLHDLQLGFEVAAPLLDVEPARPRLREAQGHSRAALPPRPAWAPSCLRESGARLRAPPSSGNRSRADASATLRVCHVVRGPGAPSRCRGASVPDSPGARARSPRFPPRQAAAQPRRRGSEERAQRPLRRSRHPLRSGERGARDRDGRGREGEIGSSRPADGRRRRRDRPVHPGS